MRVICLLRRYGRDITVVAALTACTISLAVGAGNTALAAKSNEEIALAMATFLRSARAVISDNQKLINDASKGDKGLTSAVVLANPASPWPGSPARRGPAAASPPAWGRLELPTVRERKCDISSSSPVRGQLAVTSPLRV